MSTSVQPSCKNYRMFGYAFPTISCGLGVPTSTTEPDGSLYMRVDPADANTCLYVCVGGIWTAK